MSNAEVNEMYYQQELDELRRALAEARAGQAAAEAREGELRRVLAKIEEGKGRYNRDPLEHCSNTVEDMKALADQGLSLSAPPASELLALVEEMGDGDGETLYYAIGLRRAIGLPAAPEGE